MAEVRRIRSDEGPQLRALRLRALADAPEAFAATLATEEAKPDRFWQDWARAGAGAHDQVTYLALDSGRPCGMAGAFLQPAASRRPRLVAMWVDPSRRSAGIGRALVEAVRQWARSRGAEAIELWVTETNTAAMTLYRKTGFVATGRTQPLPSNPSLREVEMAQQL